MPNILAAAIIYAVLLGWFVFPVHTARHGKCSCGRSDCNAVGKHPRLPFSKYATNNLSQIIARWKRCPDANIGVHVGKSNLVVIDVDYRHNGRVEDLPLTPASLLFTPTADTGGGGMHIFYEAPVSFAVSNSSLALPQGVDVRAQEGYVILAPSEHKSGRRYAWHPDKEPWNVHPLPLPADFYPLLKIKGEVSHQPTPSAPVSAKRPPEQRSPYVQAAFQGELNKVAQATEGSRNNSLNEAAFALGQFIEAGLLSRNEVERALTATALAIGLAENETAQTIQSGLTAGISNPRPQWPAHIFQTTTK